MFGQPVIVESKPGASTTIASQFVVKSPPDGYTWFINLALHYQNQLLYKNMPYDIFKDFANVTDICRSPVMLIVNCEATRRRRSRSSSSGARAASCPTRRGATARPATCSATCSPSRTAWMPPTLPTKAALRR